MKSILVTGAAGFIGSTVARLAKAHLADANTDEKTNTKIESGRLILLDKLTYAGFEGNLEGVVDEKNTIFVQGDIGDFDLVSSLLRDHKIGAIMNLAAESHVDNSISGPRAFIDTNITGTFTLLEAARQHWLGLSADERPQFRFLHVSTDEVFGELGETGYFTESTAYSPNSPYSASKAASDHLVRAWHHTYGLPVMVTNCSNNYGPRQFPEKLIPRMIDCAIRSEPLPVYGRGENTRDWIHVEDHAQGLMLALKNGQPGETYCFGGRSERKNIHVVKTICQILDELKPRAKGQKYEELIQFVTDRPGHDWRYAIDDSKSERELSFTRRYKNFEEGLRQTVVWYLENQIWIDRVKSKAVKK